MSRLLIETRNREGLKNLSNFIFGLEARKSSKFCLRLEVKGK